MDWFGLIMVVIFSICIIILIWVWIEDIKNKRDGRWSVELEDHNLGKGIEDDTLLPFKIVYRNSKELNAGNVKKRIKLLDEKITDVTVLFVFNYNVYIYFDATISEAHDKAGGLYVSIKEIVNSEIELFNNNSKVIYKYNF